MAFNRVTYRFQVLFNNSQVLSHTVTHPVTSPVNLGLIVPPRVTELFGCDSDNSVCTMLSLSFFPSMVCTTLMNQPITVIGEGFSRNVSLNFVPISAIDRPTNGSLVIPSAVLRAGFPCARQNVTLLPNQTMALVCHNYTALMLPSLTVDTAFELLCGSRRALPQPRAGMTIRFTSGFACPTTTEGTCAGHGTCDSLVGTCRCFQSPSTGYWGSSDCSRCIASFNESSSSCLVPCPTNALGICGGAGFCSNGKCKCSDQLVNQVCRLCPVVGGFTCSNQGTCDYFTGNCSCYDSSTLGYYAGAACTVCREGYSGSSCTVGCVRVNGVACSGHGTCIRGACFCSAAYCGLYCNVTVPLSNVSMACGWCPSNVSYGYNCGFQCPGIVTGKACSGHGECHNGTAGIGVCRCEEGYASADCSTRCPFTLSASAYCGGHGTCNQNSGDCECSAGYGGTDCSFACPIVDTVICGLHGKCSEGRMGSDPVSVT